MKKILIVEDELLVAESIAAILENEGYTIVGIAASGPEAVELFKSTAPQLVISDIRIAGMESGIDLMPRLRAIKPVHFLYLTAFADDKTVHKAAKTQPLAFIVKPFTEKQLTAAVAVAFSMIDVNPSNLPIPTKRELQIIHLLTSGKTSRQIAEELFLSEHTVQTHRKNIMEKYQTQSSSELIALAIKNRWI